MNDRLILAMDWMEVMLLLPLIIFNNCWIYTFTCHPLTHSLSAVLTGTDSELGHHDASELSGHSLADQLNTR